VNGSSRPSASFAVAKSDSQGRSMGFRVYLGTIPNYAESNDGLKLDGVRDETVPLLGEVRVTVMSVNKDLERVDGMLDSAGKIVKTLEDAPFYARSVVSAKLLGEPVTLMHESLSLDRFKMPIVQAMLPFRMPRARR